MQDFVHLHVHTQYSILDGQASIPRLVDKAMADGMKGIAVTDHGDMFGIKEFFNYVNKKNSSTNSEIKDLKKRIAGLEKGTVECDNPETELVACKEKLETAKKKLFKPIFGCEMYVARRRLFNKEGKPDQSGYHLVVLAKNEKGYHNLIKLVSKAWTEGFYMRPRTDRVELEKYHEGLIVCTACIAGEVPRNIIAGKYEEAEEAIQWYKRVFGDDFYLELQRHKATVPRANHEAYKLQQIANEKLIEYSKKFNVKLVCTNDVHFVDEENAEAHDRLICLSTGKDLDDPNRMLYSKQEWMKTRAEMNEVFADVPEALSNTVDICDQVEFYSIDHAPIMPTFAIPEDFGTEEGYRKKYTEKDLFDEFTQDENGNVVMSEEAAKAKIEKLGGYDKLYRIKLEADYLKKLALEGAHKRYGEVLSEEVQERIKFELHIMKTMGFPGYFLIVQDFIRAAREELDVSVGPGRGSAAGSAVAYCLGITKIDPIAYDLLFERFLNPDRISLPDIDVDFEYAERYRAIEYVQQKYGHDSVTQIVTFGTMAARGVIKSVGKALDFPYAETDRLAKMVPQELNITIDKALQMNPEFKGIYDSDARVHEMIDMAKRLEGLPNHTSVHAAGVVIYPGVASDYVPLGRANDGSPTAEYNMVQLEELGLLKMDFLGLRTLTVLKDSVKNIKASRGIDVDIDHIDFNDKGTLDFIGTGKTEGVFQLESAGMQSFMKELSPQSFEDIVAGISLYRPGPMDFIPNYIKGKNNPKEISYVTPELESILEPTYGCIVYQEQVMQIVQKLAGYTMGQADNIRRAMSKKKQYVIDAERQSFVYGDKERGIKGCVANGIDEKAANSIYDSMVDFAKYAFNKSHAAAYAKISVQTAWLKNYYPVEFMAALMTSVIDNSAKAAQYLYSCRDMGIKVLPPDINCGQGEFTAEGDHVRYGMYAIKSLGRPVIDQIIEERESGGRYRTLSDFIERTCQKELINKRAIENLIKAGACDSLDGTRKQMAMVYASIVDRVQHDKKSTMAGQMSLFDLVSDEDRQSFELKYPNVGEYDAEEALAYEKEVLGIYLSGHPLEKYAAALKKNITANAIDFVLEEESGAVKINAHVVIGGMIATKTIKFTKYNQAMAFITIEDLTGTVEVIIFPRDYERYQRYLQDDAKIFVIGHATVEDEQNGKIICERIIPFDELPKQLWLRFDTMEDYKKNESRLLETIRESDGGDEVIIYIADTKQMKKLGRNYSVNANNELMEQLLEFLDKENAKIVEKNIEKMC